MLTSESMSWMEGLRPWSAGVSFCAMPKGVLVSCRRSFANGKASEEQSETEEEDEVESDDVEEATEGVDARGRGRKLSSEEGDGGGL